MNTRELAEMRRRQKELMQENRILKAEIQLLEIELGKGRDFTEAFKKIESRFRSTPEKKLSKKAIALALFLTLALFEIVGTIDFLALN